MNMNYYENMLYPKFSSLNNNGMMRNKGQYMRLTNNNWKDNKQRYSNNNIISLNKMKYSNNNNDYQQNMNNKYKKNIKTNGNIENNDKFTQIKEDLRKLNNEIKKLNGLALKSKEKNLNHQDNSYIMHTQNMNNYNNINDMNYNIQNKSFYTTQLQNLNKTYEIKRLNNNNINKNGKRKYYNNKNGNLEMMKNKKRKNFPSPNKSEYEKNFDISNDIAFKTYKSYSLYKGRKSGKLNYNLDIKELDINDQDENDEKKNKYDSLKNNLNKNKYNYNINGHMDIDYSLSDSQDNFENKKKNIKINNQPNNKKDNNDSDELSDLADELVETFNIGKLDVEVDTHNIFDEKVRANINGENNDNNQNKMGEIYQKSKSNNIYYDKNKILNSNEYKQASKDLNKNNLDINKTNEKESNYNNNFIKDKNINLYYLNNNNIDKNINNNTNYKLNKNLFFHAKTLKIFCKTSHIFIAPWWLFKNF